MEDQNPWSLFIHFLWTWLCAFHSIIYRYLFSWWSDTKKFSILWGLLSLINLSIHYSKFLSRGYNFTSTVISIMKSRLQMSFHTVQNQYNLLIKKNQYNFQHICVKNEFKVLLDLSIIYPSNLWIRVHEKTCHVPCFY